MKKMEISIGSRKIGDKHPVFIIAELSANHNQDFDLAVRTIEAMKDAGVDAVKVQTYTADTITFDSDKEYFKIRQGTIWDGKTLYQLYQDAYTPWDWQPKLKKIAEELGLIFFSSPFDNSAVDFLESMNSPAYKVASFEITDISLIEKMAKTGKPIIISTGIAEKKDIEMAIEACQKWDNRKIILLKCTSAYPAPYEEANLRTIADMSRQFEAIPGLSDHTLGIAVPLAAVALGARVVEKHFILDRNQGGPDASFSLEPAEFKEMVKAIRQVEKSLGEVSYILSEKGKASREFARSLFVVKDIKKGDIFSDENVRSIRPGYGLAPQYLSEILGKAAACDVEAGEPLSWDMIVE